jgi:hypothetical protein
VAPLVGAGETVLGATAFGATAEQPAASASTGGPGGAGSDPWPHAGHDEPTVQRATTPGPLADGARELHGAGAPDDVATDAASFGPLLGDVPLTSTLHAVQVAAPPSSPGPPDLPGIGTTATVQRTTGAGGPAVTPAGTPPLQRAAVSGSWSPTQPAAPGAAAVFTGLVGTTTLVADAPAPATESVPTQGPPTGPAGTPVQRTPVPAGAVVRTTFAAPGARVGPSTPQPSVPASVQRLLAAQAAQAAEEPAPQAEVQRAAEAAPEAAQAASPPEPVAVQAATAVTAAPATGAPAQGSGGLTDVDALVGKLYDPLVQRLKAELRLDRERAGHVLDLRQ